MATHQIIIVGGGAAGVATAASLKKRRPSLDIAIVEPKEDHFYQPGWTMVGGGVFDFDTTVRPEAGVIPEGVTWIRDEATGFDPLANAVDLRKGGRITYEFLVAAPGIKLNFAAIRGLEETLGRNGVTSNYKPGMARYTFELVEKLEGGPALFTQPPPPFKCAGAPQKAMYLAADHWRRHQRLDRMKIEFHTAAPTLFGVADYVPALMNYVRDYRIALNFGSVLTAVDGPQRTAFFAQKDADGVTHETARPFDMLHVTPPQIAPDCVRGGPLADTGGWIDVDQHSMRHKQFPNVFGLGDASNAPNAKTAAAARKQSPVVAENLIAIIDGKTPTAIYDGYGSCPLTVERGKIVLAEFGYGGKLLPSVPKWLNDGTKATSFGWLLKKDLLPWIYWNLMLKGHEWLAKPKRVAQDA